MFDKAAVARPKKEFLVTVVLDTGDRFLGSVYLKYDERLIDLLNDDRAFIPVKRHDGATLIIAKSTIASMLEGDQLECAPSVVHEGEPSLNIERENLSKGPANAEHSKASATVNEPDDNAESEEQKKADDDEPTNVDPARGKAEPYRILGVDKTASMEQIRAAYKKRMKSVHPDTFAGDEIDEGKKRAALHATQLVNRAYNAILKERAREEA